MRPIIDFHTHVLPDPIAKVFPNLSESQARRLNLLRKRARAWMKPFSGSVHHLQTMVRHLPDFTRKGLDELGALVPLPGLLVESTADDLKEAMGHAGIQYAVIIPQPPAIPNEFVLELAQDNPQLIPAAYIPASMPKQAAALKKYVQKGAKMLKIHAPSEGESPDSPRYRTLLKTAADLGIPVIVHTGCFHSHLYYKDPNLGRAENYAPWFKEYPDTQFILAHMNFHEPLVAMDLAEEHANVHVDTSWQPAEVIGEAVRRVGSGKILFGTDWPFIGQNLSIGVERVNTCIEAGTMTSEDADRILGLNAAKLLGIPCP